MNSNNQAFTILAANIDRWQKGDFIHRGAGMEPDPISPAWIGDTVNQFCIGLRPAHSATGIEAEVCADIAAAQAEGIREYGQPLSENGAPLSERINHAYEESRDKTNYLKWAWHKAKGVEAENAALKARLNSVMDGLLALRADAARNAFSTRHALEQRLFEIINTDPKPIPNVAPVDWQPGQPEPPRQGWRLLEEGDVMREDDEYLDSKDRWTPANEGTGRAWSNKRHTPVRRRFTLPAEPPASIWHRTAEGRPEAEINRLRTVLEEMVNMMDSGDEHGAGSEWHKNAKAALAAKGGE